MPSRMVKKVTSTMLFCAFSVMTVACKASANGFCRYMRYKNSNTYEMLHEDKAKRVEKEHESHAPNTNAQNHKDDQNKNVIDQTKHSAKSLKKEKEQIQLIITNNEDG